MTENFLYALTQLTVLLAGLLSWGAMALGLLWLDRKFFSRIHPIFVFLINAVIASGLAMAQLLLLNLVANFFTGFGLGYAIAFAAVACGIGAIAATAAATHCFALFA